MEPSPTEKLSIPLSNTTESRKGIKGIKHSIAEVVKDSNNETNNEGDGIDDADNKNGETKKYLESFPFFTSAGGGGGKYDWFDGGGFRFGDSNIFSSENSVGASTHGDDTLSRGVFDTRQYARSPTSADDDSDGAGFSVKFPSDVFDIHARNSDDDKASPLGGFSENHEQTFRVENPGYSSRQRRSVGRPGTPVTVKLSRKAKGNATLIKIATLLSDMTGIMEYTISSGDSELFDLNKTERGETDLRSTKQLGLGRYTLSIRGGIRNGVEASIEEKLNRIYASSRPLYLKVTVFVV